MLSMHGLLLQIPLGRGVFSYGRHCNYVYSPYHMKGTAG
jgi:hypothetical protein